MVLRYLITAGQRGVVNAHKEALTGFEFADVCRAELKPRGRGGVEVDSVLIGGDRIRGLPPREVYRADRLPCLRGGWVDAHLEGMCGEVRVREGA